MEKLRIKIESFASKYNTPRVWQIFVTAFLIALPVLMFVLDPVFDVRVIGLNNNYSDQLWDSADFFHMYYYNFGGYFVVEVIVVLVALAGLVFIWTNRTRLVAIFSGSLLAVMVLTLVRTYDFAGEYWKRYNEYWDYDYYLYVGSYPNANYLILWIVTGCLIVFTILALIFTKKGPRLKIANRITEQIAPIQQNENYLSAADEIKKYHDLLVSGAITEDEYNRKKEQILGDSTQ